MEDQIPNWTKCSTVRLLFFANILKHSISPNTVYVLQILNSNSLPNTITFCIVNCLLITYTVNKDTFPGLVYDLTLAKEKLPSPRGISFYREKNMDTRNCILFEREREKKFLSMEKQIH